MYTKNILCRPLFKRIFYAPTIFNIKFINRHWTRDNMMLKHIIYVSIFFRCSWLSLFFLCVCLLNNVWLNVACVMLYRQKYESHKFIFPLESFLCSVESTHFGREKKFRRSFLIKYLILHFSLFFAQHTHTRERKRENFSINFLSCTRRAIMKRSNIDVIQIFTCFSWQIFLNIVTLSCNMMSIFLKFFWVKKFFQE